MGSTLQMIMNAPPCMDCSLCTAVSMGFQLQHMKRAFRHKSLRGLSQWKILFCEWGSRSCLWYLWMGAHFKYKAPGECFSQALYIYNNLMCIRSLFPIARCALRWSEKYDAGQQRRYCQNHPGNRKNTKSQYKEAHSDNYKRNTNCRSRHLFDEACSIGHIQNL